MLRMLVVFAGFVVFQSSFAMEVKQGKVTLEKLEDFNDCIALDSDSNTCHDALTQWVNKHPTDAFSAGKMIHGRKGHKAIPFFAKAFENKKGNCTDVSVRKAVLSALALPAPGNEDLIIQAKVIALDTCSKELTDAIVAEAKSSDYVLKNSCRDLIAKGLLSGVPAKRCTKM